MNRLAEIMDRLPAETTCPKCKRKLPFACFYRTDTYCKICRYAYMASARKKKAQKKRKAA